MLEGGGGVSRPHWLDRCFFCLVSSLHLLMFLFESSPSLHCFRLYFDTFGDRRRQFSIVTLSWQFIFSNCQYDILNIIYILARNSLSIYWWLTKKKNLVEPLWGMGAWVHSKTVRNYEIVVWQVVPVWWPRRVNPSSQLNTQVEPILHSKIFCLKQFFYL